MQLHNTKMFRPRRNTTELIYLILMLALSLMITAYALKLLYTEILIDNMISYGVDYEAFRDFRVSDKALEISNQRVSALISQYPELKNVPMIDQAGYLAYSLMARDFNLADSKPVDQRTFLRGISRIGALEDFQTIYRYCDAIMTDLQYFPVPRLNEGDVSYVDSWYQPRTYGGDRKHEGTDLMAPNNLRGYFPIISISDGYVEKIGWLEQGGYRVGIRSEAGAYFYYAHLDSYASGLKKGDRIIAGQLLGFMGDSGYGSEGTIGMFDVHLHLGIYVNSEEDEMSVNPYWILKYLEKYRPKYDFP